MAEVFYAHTPGDGGQTWQLLTDHLRGVAQLAELFGQPLGVGALARIAGALHDVGKYSDGFQEYLSDSYAARGGGRVSPRRRVDHKTPGAVETASCLGLLALPILGHHGGLPSKAQAQEALRGASEVVTAALSRARAEGVLPNERDVADAEDEARRLAGTELDADLALRLIYSCLADADALDTEAHFKPDVASKRGGTPPVSCLVRTLTAAQERLIASAPDTMVNRVRRCVYEECLAAGDRPTGVFSLTVPTGGGKTRSSLAFALRHAHVHGLERVIYAIPYTSIIEQTADVFRSIFDDPSAVLEHHSSLDEPARGDADHEWRVLAMDNWDAPIVVTTTVQLFESLFSNRPGRCRKVHRIARSVVVLDEVQTLPERLLDPILDVLRALAERYSTTVLLCTATQPALQGSPYLKGFPEVSELIGDPVEYFADLERVRYEVEVTPIGWDALAADIKAHDQCLVVVNTKRDALRLLEVLRDPAALHLSTRLCAEHRAKVLDEVRSRLQEGAACRVISTQVVEAGVDLDFPVVFRALGPLDRIVQAAGRCNREGRLEAGLVRIFEPDEGARPAGAYRTATSHAERMLRAGDLDFNDPGTFPNYFACVYRDVELDAERIQPARARLDFPTVAGRFRLIRNDSVPVLVPHDRAAVADVCCQAQAEGHVARSLWRRAQRHSVAIRRRELDEALKEGLAHEVVPDSGLYRWTGGYDPVLGLTGAGPDPADLIW